MKRILTFTAVCLILVSCGGPPRKTGEGPAGGIYPYDLEVEGYHHELLLRWKTSGSGLTAGYNIYISKDPLTASGAADMPPDVAPFNTTVFPGDKTPGDGIDEFEAEGLENGVRYYVSVRVVYSDRTMSRPTREVVAACGGRGLTELGIRYRSNEDGFSFAGDKHVPADALENDLYYFADRDGASYLAAPSRLNGFLRATRFRRLDYSGDRAGLGDRPDLLALEAADERLKVAEGDWLLVVTPDSTRALLQIRRLVGDGDQRRMHFFYDYCSVPGPFIP